MGLNVLNCILFITGSLTSFIFFSSYLNYRANKKVALAVWCSITVAVSFILFSHIFFIVENIIALLLPLILMLILFDFEKSLLRSVIFKWMIMFFISEIVSFILSIIFFDGIHFDNSFTSSEYKFCFLFNILFLSFSLLYIDFSRTVESKIYKSVMISQIAIMIFSTVVIIYILNKITDFDTSYVIMSALAIVMIYIINIFNNIIIPQTVNQISLFKTHDFGQKLTEMEYQYYQISLENTKKVKEMHHDISNHIQIVYSLFENGESQKGLEILKELRARYNNIDQIQYCNNPVINIIMLTKISEAKKNGIETNVNIKDSLENLHIPDIDLSTVICNLLDNAIRGCLCSGIQTPKLAVEILCKNQYLVIRVLNTCSLDMYFENVDSLKTTKTETQTSGFGMSIILRTVKKYKGDFSATAQNGMFAATAIMSLK